MFDTPYIIVYVTSYFMDVNAYILRKLSHKHINLFSGFLKCADCGHGMVALNKEGKHKSYICGTYRRVGKIACSTHYILDRTLVPAIKAHLTVLR